MIRTCITITLVLAATAIGARNHSAHAAPLTFNLDSAQSYVTLVIPNFTAGVSWSVHGQNSSTGAPSSSSTPWSPTTGNTAFVSGTLATDITDNGGAQTVSGIQFLSGMSNLSALTSGNYRPNAAAYNAISGLFNNNSAAPGNYAATVYAGGLLQGVISMANTTYDISSAALPASGTSGSGTISLAPGLTAGYLDSLVSVQSLGILFGTGQGSLGDVTGTDTVTTAQYSFTSQHNLQLTIPFNIPLQLDLTPEGLGVILEGSVTGQLVANATVVPEPGTMALAGAAAVGAVVITRRQRRQRWLLRARKPANERAVRGSHP